MIFHRQWKVNRLFIGLLAIVAIGLFWWFGQNRLITGSRVVVDSHPYHQLAYTKLAYQGGDFVGDSYLLDVDRGDITQLTKGGETGTVHWIDRESLIFYERPRGSVSNYFVLNVNQGTAQSTYNTNPEFNSIQQSPDGKRLILPVYADDGSWEIVAYRIIENSEDDSVILLDIEDAFMPLVWLPDSESLLYETENQEICVHDVDSNRRNCMAGSQPLLSSDLVSPMFAYTTQINGQHQLCVAQIDGQNFRGINCYDSNNAQFTGLSWRP